MKTKHETEALLRKVAPELSAVQIHELADALSIPDAVMIHAERVVESQADAFVNEPIESNVISQDTLLSDADLLDAVINAFLNSFDYQESFNDHIQAHYHTMNGEEQRDWKRDINRRMEP